MYTHSLTVSTFPALSAITINIAIIACRRTFRGSSRHLKTAVGSSEATTLHCLASNKTWPTTCLISYLYFVKKKTVQTRNSCITYCFFDRFPWSAIRDKNKQGSYID